MGNSSSSSTRSPPVYRYNNTSNTEPNDSDECRVCATDKPIQTVNTTETSTSISSSSTTTCPPCYAYSHSACPLNRAELGRSAWAYLHTLAAYYPSSPSTAHQNRMKEFFHTFSATYPCGYCADRTNEELIRNPPRVESQEQLSQWLCEVHNEVNERLNKPTFNCGLVNQRWKTGPDTGECD